MTIYNNLLKKVFIIFSIILFLLLLYSTYNHISYENYETRIIEYKDVRELPEKYTIEVAKNKGDIIIEKNKSYNQSKLDNFINNVNNNMPDEIQIVKYTEEGYPLIEQLYYTGKSLKLITDNTRHKDILSESREINTYKVKNIKKIFKDEGVLYIANLEDGKTFDIAFFKKR